MGCSGRGGGRASQAASRISASACSPAGRYSVVAAVIDFSLPRRGQCAVAKQPLWQFSKSHSEECRATVALLGFDLGASYVREHLATLLDDFRRHEREVAIVRYRGVRRQVTTYGELARTAGRFAALLKD